MDFLYRGSDEAGALFDASGRYRFALWRDWTPPFALWRDWTPPWTPARKTVAFIMLNPSTADHEQLDPTIRRCVDYAKRWGYYRLHVVNLYALRVTDSRALVVDPNAVKEMNGEQIQFYAGDQADLAIAAWGAHPLARGAFPIVRRLIAPRALRVLGLTKSGEPRHPLFMPKDCGHHHVDDLREVVPA